MSDPRALTIRLKTLDGVWETVGAGRYQGISPENFTASANSWGSDTCSFVLKRSTGAIQPDLHAFSPCEIEIAGDLVWSGRVRETPSRDGTGGGITVQGQGMQYHLDDDLFQRVYVQTRASEWKDTRSLVTTDLTLWNVGATIETNQAILFNIPAGTIVPATGRRCGVTLDLGPGSTCKRFVASWTTSNNDVNASIVVFGTDTPDPQANPEQPLGAQASAASGSTALTFTTPHRYVHIFYQRSTGVTYTGNFFWQFSPVLVFAETAYESGGASVLRADQLVTDALDRATLLLSTDRSMISTGAFVGIPEHSMSGMRTPREAITAANAYENYEIKVDVDNRMVFAPRASTPTYEIGVWPGADFEDAAGSSGDEILNRVFVEGTGPDGAALVVECTTPGGNLDATNVAQVANPSATVDATNWTAGAGALTRTTGFFQTSPAGFQLTTASNVAISVVSNTVSQTFKKGESYTIVVYAFARSTYQASTPVYGGGVLSMFVGGVEVATRYIPGTSTFSRTELTWTQPVDAANYYVSLSKAPAFLGPTPLTDPTIRWDEVALFRSFSTLADRYGFIKSRSLPVSFGITQESGQRIGDLFLAQHVTTPFRGSVSAAPGGIRRVLGGASVHPAHLLRDTGRRLRCTHKNDPNTGAVGRDGTIANVTYDHDSLIANVSLDDQRTGFEALLSRLAIVIGQAG